MKKTNLIFFISFIVFILTVPTAALSAGALDGVWIGQQTTTIRDSDGKTIAASIGLAGSVLYQENDASLYLFDELFGVIGLEKNGAVWELASQITTSLKLDDKTIDIVIDSAEFAFPDDSNLIGEFNLSGGDITGTSELDLDKVPCRSLQNNIAATNLSSDSGLQFAGYGFLCYKIDLPSDIKNLKIRTSGGQGDAEIQVSNSRPDFKMYSSDDGTDNVTDEQITIPASGAGSWYVLLYGDFTGVNLKATYDSAAVYNDVEAFITRFYQLCLGRKPDGPGLEGWVNALLDGSLTGSDVAYGFVFSQEFINAGKSDDDYVNILYEAFFNRNPDTGGYNAWMTDLASGKSREHVLNGFIYAVEFAELCELYGIKAFPGHVTKAQIEAVEAFVIRFYQLCLGRLPDAAGLEGWVNALLDGSLTGADVANGFVFSQEFINANTSDNEYVTILYKAFFNRNPDAGGFDAWIANLAAGSSREDVLKGFIGALEFENLCNDYGIIPF